MVDITDYTISTFSLKYHYKYIPPSLLAPFPLNVFALTIQVSHDISSNFGPHTLGGFRYRRSKCQHSLSEINSHCNSLSWPPVQGRGFHSPVLVRKHIRLFAWLLSQRSRERSLQYCCTIGGLRSEGPHPPG